jgi:DNA-binding MarR family transcriptional regulator
MEGLYWGCVSMSKYLNNKETLESRLPALDSLLGDIGSAIVAWQDAVHAFDEVAAKRFGLNQTDMRCLSYLAFRGPLTPGQLGELSGLTSGAVTAAIDRWEKAGHACRKRAEKDRRSVVVELTPKAWQLIEEIWGPMREAGNAALSRYPVEHLLVIRDFVRKCLEVQEAQTRRLLGETDESTR